MDQKVAAIRSQLPAVLSCVYLNTGTCGPMPEAVRTEMVRSLEQQAASRWLTDEVGLAWAFSRIRHLAGFAHERLGAVPGVRVVTPRESAGLITFQVSGMPAGDLVTRLAGQSIVARTVPHPQSVRIATGFYNTEEEIEQLAAAVSRATTA